MLADGSAPALKGCEHSPRFACAAPDESAMAPASAMAAKGRIFLRFLDISFPPIEFSLFMPLRSHPRPFAVGMQEATRGNVVGDCWKSVTIVFDLGSIELSA
jgi:hypothetical protein